MKKIICFAVVLMLLLQFGSQYVAAKKTQESFVTERGLIKKAKPAITPAAEPANANQKSGKVLVMRFKGKVNTTVLASRFNNVESIDQKDKGANQYEVTIRFKKAITAIGYNALKNQFCLLSINIPNSVTKIGGYAFDHCTALTSINIPKSVTEIGEHAFDGLYIIIIHHYSKLCN